MAEDTPNETTRENLTIEQAVTPDGLVITLKGDLDTLTAPLLDSVVQSLDDSVSNVIVDCTDLVYISSAGLRVILKLQKKLNANKASLVLTGVTDNVYEVFELTRFIDFIHVEK